MDRWKSGWPGPAPVRGIRRTGELSWIPWKWVRKSYPPGAWREMAPLFDAYRCIYLALDIEGIRSRVRPRQKNDACRRCGQCCAQLLPEPVSDDRILSWVDAGNPAHLFHAPITEGPCSGRFHTGWYHNGVRLRMCPLLLRDPDTGDKFCAVYHFGPGQRPPGCEGFKPNWPHCEVSQRPLVP